MVYLLNPKSNFTGGPMIGAFHMAKLLEVPLVQFTPSKLVEEQSIPQTPINEVLDSITKDDKVIIQAMSAEYGQYLELDKEGLTQDYFEILNKLLSKGIKLDIICHTPPGRQVDYLSYWDLMMHEYSDLITIWHHKQSYIEQIKLMNQFNKYVHKLLPYYYAPEYLLDPVDKDIDILLLYRPSKSKPSLNTEELKQIFIDKYDFDPNIVAPEYPISYTEALRYYSRSKLAFSGFFQESKYSIEPIVKGNKLEWSYLDAFYNNCIPLTSSLFDKELESLELPILTLDYLGFTKEELVDLIMKAFNDSRKTIYPNLNIEELNNEFMNAIL